MRTCRDLKGAIVGWVRLLGGSVTMSKGGFVRVSVKDIDLEVNITSRKGALADPELHLPAGVLGPSIGAIRCDREFMRIGGMHLGCNSPVRVIRPVKVGNLCPLLRRHCFDNGD